MDEDTFNILTPLFHDLFPKRSLSCYFILLLNQSRFFHDQICSTSSPFSDHSLPSFQSYCSSTCTTVDIQTYQELQAMDHSSYSLSFASFCFHVPLCPAQIPWFINSVTHSSVSSNLWLLCLCFIMWAKVQSWIKPIPKWLLLDKITQQGSMVPLWIHNRWFQLGPKHCPAILLKFSGPLTPSLLTMIVSDLP